ncbi:MAG: VWA domain-containing protein [Burkholderiales bacterium]|nr:VWA domain-containing protein [Burkholderiales bacterium]
MNLPPFPRRRVLTLAAASTALATSTPWVRAQPKTPMLMDGKKSLYQRVLTRPGAQVAPKAGAAGKAVEPFAAFFVYERVAEGGKNWLLVGAASNGKTDGYIEEVQTVPWKHAITVAFSVPSNRQRVLFFRTKEGLSGFVNGDNPPAESQKLLKEITEKGTLGPTHAVIAAEPEKFVDIQKQFYLLPVLESQSTVLKSGPNARLLKVASITREPVAPAAPAPSTDSGITNFNSAVVFVIDATSSMQPYIDRTRTAMEEVLKQAEDAKVLNRIKFGLIGFQDDPAKTKGVDYLSKVFADPNSSASREQFMTAIKSLNATKVSTRAFAEDAFAALDEALRKINWQNYGGRYIVFISDASAREGNSPLASTKLKTAQLRTYAEERGVAIYAMHLKTPEGKSDHAIAEQQYRQLSAWPGRSSLYFPVEAGDPAKFEADVKAMAKALVDQVRAPLKALQAAPAAPGADPIGQAVDSVGRAMVLSYLGRQQGTKSPPMYEAWASDIDVAKGAKPLSVRLLLTKNQLSDLQSTLRGLADAYDRGIANPASFFDQLRSAAVAMGRDPSKLGQGKAKTLEQSGLMGEYLEGLPYQSPLMKTNLNDWTNMPVGTAQAVIDTLRSNVALYQRFHDDVDRWVKLHPAAAEGDRVYPVPFDALP